ncbi:hypothetical protein H0X06_02650, partial [Candidatus Dependentiae bacterium]|nr:hypothetical protein [Candidatus Dependentiae bacterium]
MISLKKQLLFRLFAILLSGVSAHSLEAMHIRTQHSRPLAINSNLSKLKQLTEEEFAAKLLQPLKDNQSDAAIKLILNYKKVKSSEALSEILNNICVDRLLLDDLLDDVYKENKTPLIISRKEISNYSNLLHYAIQVDDLKLFTLFLDCGLDYLQKNPQDITPLDLIKTNSLFNDQFMLFKENSFKRELTNKLFADEIDESYIMELVTNYKKFVWKDDIGVILDNLHLLKKLSWEQNQKIKTTLQESFADERKLADSALHIVIKRKNAVLIGFFIQERCATNIPNAEGQTVGALFQKLDSIYNTESNFRTPEEVTLLEENQSFYSVWDKLINRLSKKLVKNPGINDSPCTSKIKIAGTIAAITELEMKNEEREAAKEDEKSNRIKKNLMDQFTQSTSKKEKTNTRAQELQDKKMKQEAEAARLQFEKQNKIAEEEKQKLEREKQVREAHIKKEQEQREKEEKDQEEKRQKKQQELDEETARKKANWERAQENILEANKRHQEQGNVQLENQLLATKRELEKLEQQKLKAERVKQEKARQEQLEEERLEEEKQKRLANEQAALKRIEQEEQERVAKETADRIEREKAQAEALRIEQEKIEQERVAKETADRIEREKAQAETLRIE